MASRMPHTNRAPWGQVQAFVRPPTGTRPRPIPTPARGPKTRDTGAGQAVGASTVVGRSPGSAMVVSRAGHTRRGRLSSTVAGVDEWTILAVGGMPRGRGGLPRVHRAARGDAGPCAGATDAPSLASDARGGEAPHPARTRPTPRPVAQGGQRGPRADARGTCGVGGAGVVHRGPRSWPRTDRGPGGRVRRGLAWGPGVAGLDGRASLAWEGRGASGSWRFASVRAVARGAWGRRRATTVAHGPHAPRGTR